MPRRPDRRACNSGRATPSLRYKPGASVSPGNRIIPHGGAQLTEIGPPLPEIRRAVAHERSALAGEDLARIRPHEYPPRTPSCAGVANPGEESRADAMAQGDRGASRLVARSSHKETGPVACQTAFREETCEHQRWRNDTSPLFPCRAVSSRGLMSAANQTSVMAPSHNQRTVAWARSAQSVQ
jgi:hypothetical protein